MDGLVALQQAKRLFLRKPSRVLAAGQLYGDDGAGNPVGLSSQLAYAEYNPGAAFLMNPGVFLDLTTAITVPATPRFVEIEYAAWFYIQTAGAGQVGISLMETTSGAQVSVDGAGATGNFLNGVVSRYVPVMGKFNLGPTTQDRTFGLSGVFFQDGASPLVAYAHYSAGPPPHSSWIKAVAHA